MGAEIIEIRRKRRFTLEEAKALLPLIRRITREAVEQVEQLKIRVEELDPEPCQRPYYEKQFATLYGRWCEKIIRLGCEPKGLWLVDFDNGAGYYCWRFPEEELSHFHGYEEGFEGRMPMV